jgi:hypothetical protein
VVPLQKRVFVVSSFFSVLSCNDGNPFSWKSIWQTKVILRVTFFAWSAALGKIRIMDNLKKWHIIVVINAVCARGVGNPWTIFSSIMRLLVPYGMPFSVGLGVSWVMPGRVVDIFACWWTSGLEVLLYGRWYFLDFCGVFGGKETN